MSNVEGDWTRPWRRTRQRIWDDYGLHVGSGLESLPTPALIVDRGTLSANIGAMAQSADDNGVRLRPHTKVQKSPDLAHLQINAGATGVTVATVWEAAAMAAAGIPDILIANEFVDHEKMRVAASLAGLTSLAVVVEDVNNIRALSRAMTEAGTATDVLIDIDVGMARCGARSIAEALTLADCAASSPGLRLVGVQAYEGHCMLEPDPETRIRLATRAMDYAAEALDAIAAEFPQATTLSGGGTGTYQITGSHPRVTELQAGSYVFMDMMHGNLVPGFDVSLHVLTTVVARHDGTIILDAGRKSIGIDFVSPPIDGFDYIARYYAEEHALFDVDERMVAIVGDRVKLVSGYAPSTVNLHDVIYVVDKGTIVDVWPVFPRGPSHHGFLQSLVL